MEYFKGKKYFNDSNLNYLTFEPNPAAFNTDELFVAEYVNSWKSTGRSKEIFEASRSSKNILCPIKDSSYTKVIFNGGCLIQDQITYTPQTIVSIYIVYEITKKSFKSDYPKLENSLFGSVKLTKNADIDRYKYSGYGIGFYKKAKFSFDDGFGQNVTMFGVDTSAPTYPSNKTQNILILGKNYTKGLNHTTIYAEGLYSINVTKINTNFCLSLHHNGSNSYLFVNGKEIYKFKTKDSEIIAQPLCIGNI